MQFALLKRLFQEGLISVEDEFPSWQEAILASVKPMVEKGMVTSEYGTSILKHVEEYGPYIFLAPHICMPHCKAYEYVNKPGICFMKCNKPVAADPNDPEMGAELFFAIASKAEGEHLEAIQGIMQMLTDEEAIEALLKVRTFEELKELIVREN